MFYNNILVFDFETCGSDKFTTEITQIGATVINPRNLEVFRGGNAEFKSKMRVLDENNIEEDALRITRMTREEVLSGPDPEEVWLRFADWCSQWGMGGKNDGWCAPIPAGHNIVNFDLPIYERYCTKYKTLRKDRSGRMEPGMFHNFMKYDTILLLGYWSENLKQPSKLGMDYLRKYMGFPQISKDMAHDALQDVRDTAAILVKLLGLERHLGPRVKFENCFGFAEDKKEKKVEQSAVTA